MTNDILHGVPNSHRNVARGRFGLTSGQFFAEYAHKNLWLVLDGVTIGFGDLRDSDIERVQKELQDGEVFIGWHESHETQFQQTKDPIVRITKNSITYPHRDSRS